MSAIFPIVVFCTNVVAYVLFLYGGPSEPLHPFPSARLSCASSGGVGFDSVSETTFSIVRYSPVGWRADILQNVTLPFPCDPCGQEGGKRVCYPHRRESEGLDYWSHPRRNICESFQFVVPKTLTVCGAWRLVVVFFTKVACENEHASDNQTIDDGR